MSGVSLRLEVDRWRRHLVTVAESTPGIVPVAKGNGYGFGLPRLAEESQRLGAEAIAVGLPSEVALVRERFAGDIVIMMPWRPDDDLARTLLGDPRVITTVSRIEDLAEIGQSGRRARAAAAGDRRGAHLHAATRNPSGGPGRDR